MSKCLQARMQEPDNIALIVNQENSRRSHNSYLIYDCARWQATQWSGLTSRKAGSWWAQMSIATGQRGWKRQPFGGLSGLGTSPFRIVRCLFRRGFGTGMADISAWV